MKKDTRLPQMPLSGGDYIDKGEGLRQVGKPTEPMPGKNDPRPNATPAPKADTPAATGKSKAAGDAG